MNKTHFNFHEEKKKQEKTICPYSLLIAIHTSVRLLGSRSRLHPVGPDQGPNCLFRQKSPRAGLSARSEQ